MQTIPLQVLMGVLLRWRIVSVTAVSSLLYSRGLLTEKLLADVLNIKYTQNLSYLTAESQSGKLLLASMPNTF
jgi:hypothetical protein